MKVEIRDEEWLVTSVERTTSGAYLLHVRGISELVRDTDAAFFTDLDDVRPVRPEDTEFVADTTSHFLQSRLFIDSMIRNLPVPRNDETLHVAQHQLLHDMRYQQIPTVMALKAQQPRLLIADAVGLGKTLEIGLLLGELIRRGRGDRILVVTPQHILEQFQHELWTRFAIPLVRLDSVGVQRIKETIPATRNPFAYFRRAIISIDTLKSKQYAPALDAIHWDAVVIDECHAVMNDGNLNNRLARRLAPQTDALILASATPHNGKKESFANLVSMLDPIAIVDRKDYDRSDFEHLFVRRMKSDVTADVGANFPKRLEPELINVHCNDAENAVFLELSQTWLHPDQPRPRLTGRAAEHLFATTLLKAACSSHQALLATIATRMKRLEKLLAEHDAGTPGDDIDASAIRRELADLHRLRELASNAAESPSTKLGQLVTTLKKIGISQRSAARAVVFSERIDTLRWLQEVLPAALGIPEKRFELFHGQMPDKEQFDVIERFKVASSEVRVLLASDVASEGVNLHAQCHHLIHFDIPWSIITIDQRNGRIDRYGQTERPEIRALLTVPSDDRVTGDLRVLKTLVVKEHEAYQLYGEAQSLLGKFDAELEEDELRRAVEEGCDASELVEQAAAKGSLLDQMLGRTPAHDDSTGDIVVETSPRLGLFGSDAEYLIAALHLLSKDDAALDIESDPDRGLVTFVPPDDLKRRLQALPAKYLRERGVLKRVEVTSNREVAEQSLAEARESTDNSWPKTAWLSPLHPVLNWSADRVMSRMQRGTAPYLTSDRLTSPMFLLAGQWSNARGQAVYTEINGVYHGGDTWASMSLQDALALAGIEATMPNPGTALDLEEIKPRLIEALAAFRDTLDARRTVCSELLSMEVDERKRAVDAWRDAALERENRTDRRTDILLTADGIDKINQASRIHGEPVILVLAAIVPTGGIA